MLNVYQSETENLAHCSSEQVKQVVRNSEFQHNNMLLGLAGIMPAVHKISLNLVKYQSKSHISVIKPDSNVTLRGILGITTNFRVFLLL